MSSNARSWTATGPGWFVEWKRTEPHLEGSQGILDALEEALSRRSTVTVAPGHTVKSDPSEPLAVLALLREAAGTVPYGVSEGAPTLPPLPDKAVG